MYQHYIIEGCDRLGKSTLIDHIKQTHGFFQVIHYGKPESLAHYNHDVDFSKYLYQMESFENGFRLLDCNYTRLIFDRFHLGEVVYSPRYRGFDGDYVFDLEREHDLDKVNHVCLILLTTSNWTFVQDDGESFDFSRKEEEQESFIAAFNRSIIKHKFIIDVDDNGFYKDPAKILAEIN